MDNIPSEPGQDDYKTILQRQECEKELNLANLVVGTIEVTMEAGFSSFTTETPVVHGGDDVLVTYWVRLTPHRQQEVTFRCPRSDLNRVMREMPRPRKFSAHPMITHGPKACLRLVSMEIDDGLAVQLFSEFTPTPPGMASQRTCGSW